MRQARAVGESASGSRAHVELVTIYAISRILNSSLDIEKTFREALNVLATHMGFRRGMVALEDADGSLRLVSAVGMTTEERERGRYRIGEGVIGRVYAHAVAMVVPDIAAEPLFLNRTGAFDAGTTERFAFAAVPMTSADHRLGVLAIDRSVNGAGGFRDDLRLLQMVAALMGQAVTLSRSVREERERWMSETRRLRPSKGRFSIDNVVGASRRIQELFAEVHQVAPTRSSVLLRGDSGTGKEAFARAIHELSPRAAKPFVKVNCAALTESLLESELFGHEKGAFTGATGERKGRFEMAHGGTLLLDEIGDVSPAFQSKLLRVLQEREFERVGGSRPIKIDVRLICATNRNLEKMVADGAFRSDLYYRINVVSLFLPPLRERREDIPLLANHFLDRYNRENTRKLRLSPKAMQVLYNCYWPGNVRELENCIERTATMTQGDVIESPNFLCQRDRCLTQLLHGMVKDDAVAPAERPAHAVIAPPVSRRQVESAAAPAAAAAHHPSAGEKPEGERERLIWAMERSGWVQAKAARLLNITPRQIGYALLKHRIEVRKF